MPNILLMARLLRPELIKAIRVTSRGVSPYFLVRKHTRRSRGHADSRVFANGESTNLFPLPTEPPPHLRRADCSYSPVPGFWQRATTSEVPGISAFGGTPSIA